MGKACFLSSIVTTLLKKTGLVALFFFGLSVTIGMLSFLVSLVGIVLWIVALPGFLLYWFSTYVNNMGLDFTPAGKQQ